MRYQEIINESLSRIVYHYTDVGAALNIISSGNFELSSSIGSVEQQYAPKGYPYFFSTTRTKHGGYHEGKVNSGVLFALDGNWFNNNYPSKSIDYWLNRDPTKSQHRRNEAEDRVFSKTPQIPISGVTAVHVYVTPDNPTAYLKSTARKLIIEAKKKNIPVYFYTNQNAWRNLNMSKLGNVSLLSGSEENQKKYISTHQGYLYPWLELIKAKEKSQLRKKADEIRYSLNYSYGKDSIIKGLSNDMGNARKPNSGKDRENLIKILNFMKQKKINSVTEFVDYLKDKWKSKQ